MCIDKSLWSYKSYIELSTKFESDQGKLSDCIPDPQLHFVDKNKLHHLYSS